MPAPANFTILVVTSGTLCRAEISGTPPRVAKLFQPPRPAQGTLSDLLEAAALPGGKLRGPVWVLTDDVFMQVARLNPEAVRDLKNEDVGRALGYEAQVMSGMGPAEAALGWRGLRGAGKEREFQVVQMPLGDVDRVVATLRKLGGKLGGIAHPAALPARLDPESSAPAWGRLEVWRGMYVMVDNPDGAGVSASVMPNVGPRSLRAIAGSEVATECLVASAEGEPADLDGMMVFRLNEDASLRWWLEGWAQALRQPAGSVAQVVTPEKPLSGRGLLIAGAVAALLIAGLGAVRVSMLKGREEAARKSLTAARVPIVQLDKIEAEIAARQRELQLLSTGETQEDVPAPGYLKRVMEAVATRRPKGVIISRLDLAWDRSTIYGQSVTPGAADVLAGALTEALAADNRLATPGAKRLNDGLYEFQIGIAPKPGKPR